MIVQLQSQQIASFWEVIETCIIKSLSIPEEYKQDFAIKQIEKMYSGDSQCWLMYELEGDERKIYAVGATRIEGNSVYGFKMLNLYAIHGLRPVSQELYVKNLELLEQFAKNMGCRGIIGQTNIPYVKDLMLGLGFEEDLTVYKKYF